MKSSKPNRGELMAEVSRLNNLIGDLKRLRVEDQERIHVLVESDRAWRQKDEKDSQQISELRHENHGLEGRLAYLEGTLEACRRREDQMEHKIRGLEAASQQDHEAFITVLKFVVHGMSNQAGPKQPPPSI